MGPKDFHFVKSYPLSNQLWPYPLDLGTHDLRKDNGNCSKFCLLDLFLTKPQSIKSPFRKLKEWGRLKTQL